MLCQAIIAVNIFLFCPTFR